MVFRKGERLSIIEFVQFQGSSSVSVGQFNTSDQRLDLSHHLLKFKGGRPPRDRTEVRPVQRHVTLLLYVVTATTSSLIILLSLSILCFSLINRKLRLVLWRSQSQEELLLLGVVLGCCSVLVSGLDQISVEDRTRTVLCSVQLWTLTLGHSVVFSGLFSYAWSLFSRSHRRQQSVVQRPGCVLSCTLLLDVFVLSFCQVLDPLRRVELQHQPQPVSDEDVMLQQVSFCCRSTNTELWFTAVCGYKGPLLGLGLFVVWSLGPGLVSLSLKSGLSALSLFSALGLLAYISHDPLLQFSLSSGFILSCCLCVLFSVFAPKLFLLWVKGSEQKLPSEIEEEEEPDTEMKMIKHLLEVRTAQLEVEIETIRMQLSETSELETDREAHEACGGGGRSVWTHQVQISAENRGSESDLVNSPEQLNRRVSLQLPILHHSYLPVIGGVSPSSTDTSLH